MQLEDILRLHMGSSFLLPTDWPPIHWAYTAYSSLKGCTATMWSWQACAPQMDCAASSKRRCVTFGLFCLTIQLCLDTQTMVLTATSLLVSNCSVTHCKHNNCCFVIATGCFQLHYAHIKYTILSQQVCAPQQHMHLIGCCLHVPS
ncbi:TPA: hypothetical protein ACH3X2_003682 [Trebouxia sp. C0005]